MLLKIKTVYYCFSGISKAGSKELLRNGVFAGGFVFSCSTRYLRGCLKAISDGKFILCQEVMFCIFYFFI